MGEILILISALVIITCWIFYRSGYSAGKSALSDEIFARKSALNASEADFRCRENILMQERQKLAADWLQFEEKRAQNIDSIVQSLWRKKGDELQAEHNREREELRERYKEECGKLRTRFEDEHDREREELRERYREERDKLRAHFEEVENETIEAERLARIAEDEFRKEYEKWRKKNLTACEDSEELELSAEQMLAFAYIAHSRNNIFVQGQAGTGKSTLIKHIRTHCGKSMLLASPTGAAAKIIGGETLHSLFGLPARDFIDINKITNTHIWAKTRVLLEEANLVIIDEVSMVRPDMLDAIDHIAKIVRGDSRPFGGLQIVLIGDLFQLPPVITSGVKDIFKTIYGHENAYFFDAPSCRQGNFTLLCLDVVFRQSDDALLNHLGKLLRLEELDDTVSYFNSAKITDVDWLRQATTLTPTRKAANKINYVRLSEIDAHTRTYHGSVTGNYEISQAPAPYRLTLKVGALVLFTNNSTSIRNGTSAIVTELSDDYIKVHLLENGQAVGVERDEWKNFEYQINGLTNIIEEVEIGSFSQFPLQLGYAITVHKSQGRTLDKAIIDKMHARFFAHGQLYVALSRTRTKDDIHIERPLIKQDVIVDERVLSALRSPAEYGFRVS